jgi:transcriptional regulator with XRE-family HTH domain
MRKRNNIFAEAFRWIKKNVEGIKYQKDLAARIGVSEDTITRIMRDQTEVTDDFLCKFNEAFDNVFNYQWLRGEDNEPMLAAELGKSNPHQSAQSNADLLEIYAQRIRLVDDLRTTLKEELEEVRNMRIELQEARDAFRDVTYRLSMILQNSNAEQPPLIAAEN